MGASEPPNGGGAAKPESPGRNTVVLSRVESRVGGGVLALVEHRLDVRGVEVGMQFDAIGADDAVARPRVDEIRILREMRSRIDVVITRGDGVMEAALGQPSADRP